MLLIEMPREARPRPRGFAGVIAGAGSRRKNAVHFGGLELVGSELENCEVSLYSLPQ